MAVVDTAPSGKRERLKNTRAYKFAGILFVEKSDQGIIQLFRYGFVGGFSAVVDVGALYLLTSKAHIHYLISVAIAFVFGTIVNYLLSVVWVFESSGKLGIEFALFTLIGVGGLGLTELIIWLSVSKAHLNYLVGKLIALTIVVAWSFVLRKLLFARLAKRVTVS